MIGLDTNVIVRYLVQDEPIESRRATRIIERELSETEPGFISVIALAETSWVLQRSYGVTDGELATTIESLLQIDVFACESEQEVFAALAALRSGNGSFTDALIGELGAKAGCSHTVTFDKKAARLAKFALVP